MDPNSDLNSIEKSLSALATRLSANDSIDPQTRQILQKATQRLSFALETPGDAFQRIAFLVKLRSSAALLSPVHVLISCWIASAPPNYSRSHRTRPWLVRKFGAGRAQR